MYTALHYIPKPGGGVAAPGEVIDPAKFTSAQITSLLKSGAVKLNEEAPVEIPAEPAPASDNGAPIEIDALEGIVSAPKKRRKKA